jgi:DNA mismatch repair protein MutS
MTMTTTPMMQQYQSIKARYSDAVLFFRLGDFYEMFFDDAVAVSGLLGLTLTGRGKGDQRVPMCGVPFHAAEGYIAKLVQAGHKVAVCEQLESDKNDKGPTHRDVVRVITPGTVQLASVLESSQSNFLGALSVYKRHYGVAFLDISTGAFLCDVYDSIDAALAAIHRMGVVELLVEDALMGQVSHTVITPYFSMEPMQAATSICAHFSIQSLAVFGLEAHSSAYPAIVAVLDYIALTQKHACAHIRKITPMNHQHCCVFDRAVMDHLGLFDKPHGLFALINRAKTTMGSRQLQHDLRCPLTHVDAIRMRHDHVAYCMNGVIQQQWHDAVAHMTDIPRIVSRICSTYQNPKDMAALLQALQQMAAVGAFLSTHRSCFGAQYEAFQELVQGDASLQPLRDELSAALLPEVPAHLREGGIFNPDYSPELRELCQSFESVRVWMQELEPRLRELLGIKSLKVGFNKVFGYYIEVPNAQKDKVPSYFVRKQTLANAERYITPKLKDKETVLLNGNSHQIEIEKKLYTQLEKIVASHVESLQLASDIIAYVDAIVALAAVAMQHKWVRPTIRPAAEKELALDGLWHPMVAAAGTVIPNDVHLPTDQPFMLITGPNMAGKSTLMRSVAIAVILGQMGSFVPAASARFSVVTSLYTRIGANDKLAEGQSTFMVEMVETARICHNATAHSLLILDEVGRGTSTFDGVSIAAAVTDYLVTTIKARTLFATHYHELTALAARYPAIQNRSMRIKEVDDALVFTYTLVPGPAEKSYGVMVAKMAGLPVEIIQKADAWLAALEKTGEASHSLL